MNEWKNLNELSAYQQLLKAGRVDLTKVMAGEPKPGGSGTAVSGAHGCGTDLFLCSKAG